MTKSALRRARLVLPVIAVGIGVVAFQNCSGLSSLSRDLSASSSITSTPVAPATVTTSGVNLPAGAAVGKSFEIISSGTVTAVQIQFPTPPTDRFRGVEAPPWIVKGGSFGYAITTAESSNCWSDYSIAQTSVLAVQCNDVNTSSVMTHEALGAVDTPTTPWIRNYNGIMSSFPVNDPTHGQILLTVHHGENLNQVAQFATGTVTMQNSISNIPSEQVANCFANYAGTSSASPLDCYWGFISMGWIPYTAASSWGSVGETSSVGPVTWPVDGYINADGTQASRGARHPSGIIDNGYLYIFYLDASLGNDRGIRVVRAPVAQALTPSSWQRLSGGQFVTGTLPTGFQIVNNQIDQSFYKMHSPPMDFAFTAAERPDRFAVARMVGGGYIGIEVGLDNNGLGELGVRTSADLINWSARQLIPIPGYNQGGTTQLAPAYALPMSADGTSNNDIDPNNFYIIGTIFGTESILRIPMHLVGGALPTPAIRANAVNAGTPMTCDQFNPIAVQSMTNDVITALGTLQTTGITLAEDYMLARQNGYTGAFGAGEHLAWLTADPTRLATFNSAVSTFANTASPPYATWITHNQARRAAGYNGLFLCGGDNCWVAGNCDSYGRANPGVSLSTALGGP